ncbi:MAG: thioredoxin domain-containing protein, partial [Candidatus Veblenbacteria bacterium]|nr:thioredoxin domain-containing protein [Candidatus Veblenbacteria bacterium]
AALAAECANDQGKFWEYHDQLFDKQPNFSRDELVVYATELGLTIEGESGFAACLDSRAETDVVRADMREGDQRKVSGTPTFFLNGEAVQDWSQLKAIIQAKLIGG